MFSLYLNVFTICYSRSCVGDAHVFTICHSQNYMCRMPGYCAIATGRCSAVLRHISKKLARINVQT